MTRDGNNARVAARFGAHLCGVLGAALVADAALLLARHIDAATALWSLVSGATLIVAGNYILERLRTLSR